MREDETNPNAFSGLRRVSFDELDSELHDPVDAETIAGAAKIVDAVRRGGREQLERYGRQFGDIDESSPVTVERDALESDVAALDPEIRALLQRCAGRIRSFAERQRAAFIDMTCAVDGGSAGHRIAAVERAGCYAPGGRFPLPSSVLMTAITARVAGVRSVVVCSPKPSPVTRAACAIAGADRLLCVGGAQGIAALAYGVEGLRPVDVIVGPGNRWVTAAKHLVSLHVGIDMLAGPSELVVIADATADPGIIAADLLAQAEHDPDALPILITTDTELAEAVDAELATQLAVLETREVAREALANGYTVVCASLDDAIAASDRLAPEHLELLTVDPESVLERVQNYGGVFVGSRSAEVFGDYGLGPNHVLPTGRSARYRGGLSVLDFLRVRTQLSLGPELSDDVIRDCVELARLEGLVGHAEAAARRLGSNARD